MSQPHQNSFRTETHGNQTLHVRENSDSALEDLFSVVQNPNPNKQSDWTGRNLPRSFFNPPQPNQNVGTHPNHSRNGSQDSTHFGQNLVPNHHRSRSAPVQLAPSLSLPQQAPPPQHAKHPSIDLVEDMQTMQLSQQSNWGNNANNQSYNFVGPNNQQSPQQQQPQQWSNSSPSKSHSATALNQQSPGALSPNHSLSPAVSLQSVIAPLPPGWEMSVTPDGEIYYINHIDKTTSWFHPHMSNKSQQGPTKLNQLHPQHQLAIQQHIHQQQAATLAQQTQQQLQQQTAANQQQQTLSQTQSQMASPNGALIGQRAPNGGVLTSPSAGSNNTDAYIRSELLKLQKQKETLRRQQEEIAKKESQLAMMKDGSMGPSQQPANPAMQAAVTTSGVDPFLGHNDSHARQNSADSGLGGMGQYSLPRTPEDFLSNVDEMDSTDGAHKAAKAQSSDFNMNEMEGMGMDVAGMSDPHSAPMDEHELMPSLQDDISSELLEGMEGQKIDNLLTWL